MLYEENAPSYRYFKKLLGFGPIALWPMNEQTGLVSYDISGNGFDGAYTGVTLAQPGIGDGGVCPFFDGANDYNNIYSAGLAAAFNGSEGTFLTWLRVANVGVWADGIERRFGTFISAVGGNFVLARKLVGANALNFIYSAGGVTLQVNHATNTAASFSFGGTWSAAANEVRAYFNGAQTGATQVGLGVWAGALLNTQTVIGAGSTVPTNPWHGYQAYAALFDAPLTPAQMAIVGVL